MIIYNEAQEDGGAVYRWKWPAVQPMWSPPFDSMNEARDDAYQTVREQYQVFGGQIQEVNADDSVTWISSDVLTHIPGTDVSVRPTNVWRTYFDSYGWKRTIPEPGAWP